MVPVGGSEVHQADDLDGFERGQEGVIPGLAEGVAGHHQLDVFDSAVCAGEGEIQLVRAVEQNVGGGGVRPRVVLDVRNGRAAGGDGRGAAGEFQMIRLPLKPRLGGQSVTKFFVQGCPARALCPLLR